MLNSFDIVIFFSLIILCVVVTYTDLKHGKISNKIVIRVGSILATTNVVNVALLNDWNKYIINVFAVVIVAIVLYTVHAWAGGDCKMMILIALASPTNLYWEINNLEYTLWIVYAFIFSFGFIYITFENLYLVVKKKAKLNKHDIIAELRKGIIRYIKVVIYLAALGHIYMLCVYPYIQLPIAIYTIICIVFIFILSKVKIFNIKWVVIFVALVDIVVSILTGNLTISTTWYTYATVLLLMLLRTISNKFNYEDIETGSVKKGMIISQETSILFQSSRVKGLPGISDESLKSRLSEEEAIAIRRWKDSKYGQDYIRIVRKIPFAIFITIGLIFYFSIGSVLF